MTSAASIASNVIPGLGATVKGSKAVYKSVKTTTSVKKAATAANKTPKTTAAKSIRSTPKIDESKAVKASNETPKAPVTPKLERGQPNLLLKLDLQFFAKDTAKGTGKVDDFAKEPFLPDEYYKNNYAPMQGTPGARIDFSRLGSSGKVENSRVIYDQAGKQKYRIDYSDHGNSVHHTNPHMHEYIYQDAGKSVKAEIKYFMDSSTGRIRQGIIDGKTNKIKFID